jgi:acyl carrier protein
MTGLRDRLTRCFTVVFPKLPAERISTATPETVEDWDSIRFLTLARVIEEEFGIAIDDSDIDMVNSFESILELLKRHGA